MRIILLTIFALAGCSTTSGGGTGCIDEEGKAPCCSPPAVKDLVCDEGAEVVHQVNESSEEYACRIEGDQEIYGDSLVMIQGGAVNYAAGDEIWNCAETGRATVVVKRDSSCFHGCWDADGAASDHCQTASMPACD